MPKALVAAHLAKTVKHVEHIKLNAIIAFNCSCTTGKVHLLITNKYRSLAKSSNKENLFAKQFLNFLKLSE